MPSSSSTIDALISSVHATIAVRRAPPPPQRTERPSSATIYAWGTALDFSATGNARRFFGPGWSEPEPQCCWTEGTSAELHLPVSALKGTDLILTAQLSPLVSAQTTAQLAQVSVNGALTGQWLVSRTGPQFVLIFARHFAEKNRLTLRFDLPRAFSPQAQGLSADPRVLALAFHSLSLGPVNQS